ncbi:MAG: hypothetical protein HC822_16850, partial [Oscillochloris sp.]|nr:hypothetical protein [Oscillochloris sp.]
TTPTIPDRHPTPTAAPTIHQAPSATAVVSGPENLYIVALPLLFQP